MRSVWSDLGGLGAWLFFRPSAWQRALAAVDPALSPGFALSDLHAAHWRSARLLRLLAGGFLLLPVLTGTLLSAGLGLLGDRSPLAVAGILLGMLLGGLFGLAVSAAAGIGVAITAVAAFLWVWRDPAILAMDMALGVGYALIFGTCSAVAVHLLVVVGGRAATTAARGQIFRQLGGFLIAAVISSLIFLLAIGATGNAISSRQSGTLPLAAIPLIVAGLPALLLGLAIGWRTRSPQVALRCGILLLLAFLLLFGDAGQQFGRNLSSTELLLALTSVILLLYGLLFVVPFALVDRLGGTWAGAVAGALSSVALYAIIGRFIPFYALWANTLVALGLVALGLTMHWWRPLLCYPFEAAWNTLLLRAEEQRSPARPSLLRWHAVFWDELQFLPLYGLDDHLVLLCERNPEGGREALARIGPGPQRWAAQAAQIELDARRLQRCTTIEDIAAIHWQLAAGELSGPANAILHSFSVRSRDVDAALQQISFYNQRITLNRVQDALNALFGSLLRSSERYARRFAPVVQQWERIITDHMRMLTTAAETHQEVPNPYIVGQPLTRQEELFVGRTDLVARLEDLLTNARHPPLLLYGQRRMGKTSLLYNLRWMLPSAIVPLLVDLQGTIASSTSHADFVVNFAKSLHASLGSQGIDLLRLDPAAADISPFTALDAWLDTLEEALVAHGRTTALLTLDEFEALDQAFTDGRLRGDLVLGMLRHLFQHRPRFKLLLAGSHTLDEFQRWASYLINAPVLHLSYLRRDEALALITQPIKEFPLRYAPEAGDHVLALTRGHPYLVQLLCREIVHLKNEGSVAVRRRVSVEDVERAVPQALAAGAIFFSDILYNQISAEGEHLLRALARQGPQQGFQQGPQPGSQQGPQQESQEGPQQDASPADAAGTATQWDFAAAVGGAPDQPRPPDLARTLDQLVHREILENAGGRYRFQVELVRRWFADPDQE